MRPGFGRSGSQDLWLGRLRVITFLPAIGLAYFGLFLATASAGWLIAAAILVVAFMVIVRIHEQALRPPRNFASASRSMRLNSHAWIDTGINCPPRTSKCRPNTNQLQTTSICSATLRSIN